MAAMPPAPSEPLNAVPVRATPAHLPTPCPRPMDAARWLEHCAGLVGQLDDTGAEAAFAEALRQCPNEPRLHYNHGVLLQRLGREDAARMAWRQVCRLVPGHAKAHARLAELALATLDAPEALARARAAVDALTASGAMPDSATLCLLGKAAIVHGDWVEAEGIFMRAHALDAAAPQVAEGLRLGRVLASAGQWTPDDGVILPAPWLAPRTPDGGSPAPAADALGLYISLGMQRLRAGDWRHRPGLVRAIQQLAAQASPPAGGHDPAPSRPPGTSTALRQAAWEALHLDASPRELQALARAASRQVRHEQQPQALVSAKCPPAPGTRLRIAYLSHNVRRHPTSYLINRVLAAHARDQVEVHLYSLNPPDGSALRGAMEAAVEHHHPCHGWPARAVAQRIADDGIEVLVGLGGHCDGPVLDVAVWQPAPVQVNYLSFCGTVGDADAFQYHLCDEISVPPDSAGFYDEALVYLSAGHYAYDESQPVPPSPSRGEAGLPEQALVLCGFNNGYKITPATFDVWCRLLHALPEGILWLYEAHAEQPAWLRIAAVARGIDPQRLVFAPPLPSAEHLARLRLADLYLDSFSYNGHTTLLDALFCRVPAITLPGDTAAKRIGSALLHAVGLSDGVATSTHDYLGKAIGLARDPLRREAIRRHLAQLPGHHLPFDSPARAAELEKVYRHMASRARCGLPFEAFTAREL
ncbi:MAG: hypothetical protein EOP40_14310 [Rubrivivax sp.]|nr:MAG: hypothetical protein EOP40_14310 [Rubrivivax sp.]